MLEAFAAGCGGKVVQTSARQLAPGPAAFYGVRPEWAHLWRQARSEGRDWYYLDNAWFDCARERFFRIGVNAMQSWSQQPSDGRRLRALGVQLQERPARQGRHIVLCRQSDEFMRFNAGWPGGALGWQDDVLEQLRHRTERPIVVRAKQSSTPLAEELQDAWLLVTHASAAAIEAVLAGVPVIVTDPDSAAARFSVGFEQVEDRLPPQDVRPWAERLADSQWTLNEMQAGMAWRAIREA